MAWKRILYIANTPKGGGYAMTGEIPTTVVAADRKPGTYYRRAVEYEGAGGPWWVFVQSAAGLDNAKHGYAYRACAGAWLESDINIQGGGAVAVNPEGRFGFFLLSGVLHVCHSNYNEDGVRDRYYAKVITSAQCVGAPTIPLDTLVLDDDGSFGPISCSVDENGNRWLCCHYRPGGANGRVRVFRNAVFSVDTDLASNSISGTIVPIGGNDVFLIADSGGGNPLVWKSYIGGAWGAQAALINDFTGAPSVTRRATDGRMFVLYIDSLNELKLVGFDSDGVIDETAIILADATPVTYLCVSSGGGRVFCLYLKGAGSIYGKFYEGGSVSSEFTVVPLAANGQTALNCSYQTGATGEVGIVWWETGPLVKFSKFPT